MVDLGGAGPMELGINNVVLIIPAIIVLIVGAYFGYRFVSNLREKKKRDDRRKAKQRRERDVDVKKNDKKNDKTKNDKTKNDKKKRK